MLLVKYTGLFNGKTFVAVIKIMVHYNLKDHCAKNENRLITYGRLLQAIIHTNNGSLSLSHTTPEANTLTIKSTTLKPVYLFTAGGSL